MKKLLNIFVALLFLQAGGTGPGVVPVPSFDLAHSPDVPPAAPNALDCEFDGSTICSFAWVNQGSATGTVANGYLDLSAPSPGGVSNAMHLIQQTLPAAPYAFTTKLEMSGIPENFHSCGLVLRESATGKIFYWAFQYSTSASSYFQSTAIAYASVTGGTTGRSTANLQTAQGYLRVARSGSTLTFYYSQFGTGWLQLYSESVTTDFTTAPDQIGVGCDSVNATNSIDGIFWWFRRTT